MQNCPLLWHFYVVSVSGLLCSCHSLVMCCFSFQDKFSGYFLVTVEKWNGCPFISMVLQVPRGIKLLLLLLR